MGSELVKPHHLDRRAVVYVRQSSPQQVLNNQESLRLQYALRQRACDLGWREADVEVVDADLGLSGASAAHRQGFKDLVARIALGEIGLIVSIEVTRLARNCSDWYPLLDICGHRGCLIADRDAVYDPGLPDGRLLLGLKGTISELELHTIRGRLTAGLLSKARRGELALHLPAGLVRDPSGVVTKDPKRVSKTWGTTPRVGVLGGRSVPVALVVRHQPGRSARRGQAGCPRFLTLPTRSRRRSGPSPGKSSMTGRRSSPSSPIRCCHRRTTMPSGRSAMPSSRAASPSAPGPMKAVGSTPPG
jgi:DNA invertase Pin-like site-specific DNA recombinase